MHKLIIIAIIMALGACTDEAYRVPDLATTRLCDTVSYYIATIINPSPKFMKAKYIVYVDTNNNKKIESTEPIIYRSPVLNIGRFDQLMSDHIPIDTLWNHYTLLTELQSTLGKPIIDHVHPCERYVMQ